MNIFMSGLEHSLAPIQLREQLSFTQNQTGSIVRQIRSFPGICGCVLISTCNRTELYITSQTVSDPGQLLCQAAGAPYEPYRQAFVTRSGREAVRHLAEVASGLRSRIWGEDQILSQVKNAIAISREAGCADPILETLFRTAVSAGKQIKTDVRLTSVPASAASMAVELLKKKLGSLEGRTAMVIGNGEMGRLSAVLLQKAGCHVSVTLRTYRHGETVVPSGCRAIPYDERFAPMENTEILVSATTSPHYTVTRQQLEALKNKPSVLVDLAIPRDIEPEAAHIPNVTLYNIDDLGENTRTHTIPQDAEAILTEQIDNFYRWLHYRECMPSRDTLKQAITERLMRTVGQEADPSLVQLSVSKTVDLLLGGMAGQITPEVLDHCECKIRSHTIGKPESSRDLKDFRFPLFVTLNDKKAVVIGGGKIALRRVGVLRSFGAQVTVIAPQIGTIPEGVTSVLRPYAPGDLQGAFLAVAATDSREVNRQVGQEAAQLGIPVSVCDSREESTFFFPAVCQRNGLVAGVVSDGSEHCKTARAAEAIRHVLEESI